MTLADKHGPMKIYEDDTFTGCVFRYKWAHIWCVLCLLPEKTQHL